jgi:hypothetical protein
MAQSREDIDDTTAAQVGHAVIRFLIDEDPAGIARFTPNLAAADVDDAKAARIAHSLLDLLGQLDVA